MESRKRPGGEPGSEAMEIIVPSHVAPRSPVKIACLLTGTWNDNKGLP